MQPIISAFLVLDLPQRGVPWNPWNHPKSATVWHVKQQEAKIINIVELCQAVATLPDYTGFLTKSYNHFSKILLTMADTKSSLYRK